MLANERVVVGSEFRPAHYLAGSRDAGLKSFPRARSSPHPLKDLVLDFRPIDPTSTWSENIRSCIHSFAV